MRRRLRGVEAQVGKCVQVFSEGKRKKRRIMRIKTQDIWSIVQGGGG